MNTAPLTVADIVGGYALEYGKLALHNALPRDFEFYFCALELVDPNGDPIDYFGFPIMPRNITKNEREVTSVQQALAGVVVLNKDAYIPTEITLQGDFGRAFKFTMFETDKYYKGLRYSISDGYYSASDINSGGTVSKSPTLPIGIKSGYGCIKILQSMISKARAHDEKGKTFRLYFYNYALGEAYLVVPSKNPLTLTQSMPQSNMIWNYQLNLVVIADLKNLDTQKSKLVKEKLPLNTKNIFKHIIAIPPSARVS